MDRTTSNRSNKTDDSSFRIRNKIKLSKRELEILLLISHERSEKDIADNLGISYHTVHAHKRNLLRKLNKSTAAGLVRKGFELGLLE